MLDCKSPWQLIDESDIRSRNANSDPSDDSSGSDSDTELRGWRRVLSPTANAGSASDYDAALAEGPGHVLSSGSSFTSRSCSSVTTASSKGGAQAAKKPRPQARTPESSGDGTPAQDPGLPSAGSAGHEKGECKPCILFAKGPGGCSQGSKCKYCHVPGHDVKSCKPRMRPGKGKRDRYQKFAQKVIGMIDQNPEGFDLDELQLPTSISRNDRLRFKFTRRMQGHHEALVTDGPRRGTDGDVDGDVDEPQDSRSRPMSLASTGAQGGRPPVLRKKLLMSL